MVNAREAVTERSFEQGTLAIQSSLARLRLTTSLLIDCSLAGEITEHSTDDLYFKIATSCATILLLLFVAYVLEEQPEFCMRIEAWLKSTLGFGRTSGRTPDENLSSSAKIEIEYSYF